MRIVSPLSVTATKNALHWRYLKWRASLTPVEAGSYHLCRGSSSLNSATNRREYSFKCPIIKQLSADPARNPPRCPSVRALSSQASQRAPCAPSVSSIQRFRSSPPPNPVSWPLRPITLWQGTTTGQGFRAIDWPTARAADGDPTARAISP